ncbi:WYL domain-containing protein [Sulfurospirillum diekertiae]|jgi:predicted DNA-binding transcriptional regulator YafY|uniref:WYL domain-containing protein n=1 Tax=Sulfurospirillum diekertiae TaxID=1854492 RepID=A0A6G9VQT6_9BACT|nr:WYL domain-containing protein [Sulfurospirillum diekertiae]QIR75246.1 WYL domain-containing protein [Sulfurospirillum diekertiae]QIR77897.1 WYL domain-containing protein [Sulfurospirillum diekertiae]
MKSTTTEKKIIHIFTLMQKLYEGEELYPQNERILDELGVNERTLRRYLEDIHRLYGDILVSEKKQKYLHGKKVSVYRVPNKEQDISKTLRFFLEESNELSWILTLINENNPRFLKQLSLSEKEAIEQAIAQDKEVFLFKSNPFENLQDEHERLFSQLKIAVKHHEYRTIIYRYDNEETVESVKCLKLIFTNNNWYLAIETANEELRLLRIAFIKEVRYSAKTTYQKHVLAKYRYYFESMQNAMSLQGVALKTAVLKASPSIRRYFLKEMKPFFASQKFIEAPSDGSVIFSVDYTQPIEILPFVKQWLPELEILEPKELRILYKTELQKALAQQG